MRVKRLDSGHVRSSTEGGTYHYKRDEFEWTIEKLRYSRTGNSGCWLWYLSGKNTVTRNLIQRLYHQNMTGGSQTLRDAEWGMADLEKKVEPRDRIEDDE